MLELLYEFVPFIPFQYKLKAFSCFGEYEKKQRITC